jgi:signal transduction histidine kinase
MANKDVDLPLLINPGAGFSRYLSALVDLVLVYFAFKSIVRAKTMTLWIVGNALFMVAWGIVVVSLLFVRIDARQVLGVLRPISRALLIGTIASIISIIWMLMPYAPPDLRLVVAMFIFGFVAVMVLSMPEMHKTVRLGIIAITGSIVLFFGVYGGRWTIAVIIFGIMYGIAMYVLSAVFPNALRDAIAARMEAEAARDAKTRFLASASHDLGQPLQAARMFFDQAMRSKAGVQRDTAVRGVHWAFDATEQLLGQMMAHLRLESGTVEARIETLVVGLLISEVAEMNEPAAGLAGVTLHAMSCGLKVRADRALVERALGNLVNNAIRHAKAKRILLGARRTEDRLRIWVIDDGRGIPPADLPHLFEEYVQGSDHGDEIRGGFGLGLATTRGLARLMGGDVGLEPRWVKGSAFWLDLPAA